MKTKAEISEKEIDRSGYRVIQMNALELGLGKKENGMDVILMLLHSDEEKITSAIEMDRGIDIINSVSALLNGWKYFNHEKEKMKT